MNISRIKKRVSLGGHHIPSVIVRRRQVKCFENFWNIYRSLSDEWSILDNSKNKPKLVHSMQSLNALSAKDRARFSQKFLRGMK